jgi:prepilin-type N-terminal cleavage/methylation domain-containing protein
MRIPLVKRFGFSMVEMLIVVVIIGLMGLIALPKLNAAFDQSNVISAKSHLTALFAAARTAATSGNQTAVLRLNGNQIYVYAYPRRKAPFGANTKDTIVRPTNLATTYGVTLGGGFDSVRVASSGLGMDSALVIFTKRYAVDTVIISRYGRVLR